MPGKSKFTKEQQAFLRTFVDGYDLARSKRRKPVFREEISAIFFEKWPVCIPADWEPIEYPPPPPPAPNADPATIPLPSPSAKEQREDLQYELETERKKQIMNWFGNHTGSRAIPLIQGKKMARSVLVQLILGGIQKRRISKAQSHHAYLRMDPDRVLPVIRAEWRAMKESDPNLNNDQKIAFTNRRLKELLAAEPQEVRDRVELFREEDLQRRLKDKDGDDEGEDEIVVPDAHLLSREEVARRKIGLTRQRAIERLPGVLSVLADVVFEYTGLIMDSMASGPQPARGGETIFVNSGTGRAMGTGLSFAQDYSAFAQNVKNPYARFAHKCIPLETWNKYNIQGASSPQSTEATAISAQSYSECLAIDERALSSARRARMPSSASSTSIARSTTGIDTPSTSVASHSSQSIATSSSIPATSNATQPSSASTGPARKKRKAKSANSKQMSRQTRPSRLEELMMSSDEDDKDVDLHDAPEHFDQCDSLPPSSPQLNSIPSSASETAVQDSIPSYRGQIGTCELADRVVVSRFEPEHLAQVERNHEVWASMHMDFGGAALVGGSSEVGWLDRPGLSVDFEVHPQTTLPSCGASESASALGAGSSSSIAETVSLSLSQGTSSLTTTLLSSSSSDIHAPFSLHVSARGILSSTADGRSSLIPPLATLTSSPTLSGIVDPFTSPAANSVPPWINSNGRLAAPISSPIGLEISSTTHSLLSSQHQIASNSEPSSSFSTGNAERDTISRSTHGAGGAQIVASPVVALTRSYSSLADVQSANLPEWMKAFFNYFSTKLRGKEEDTVLLEWVRLESEIVGISSISTIGMPPQLLQFVQQTRRLTAPPTTAMAREYAKTFRTWYTSLMPNWQKPAGKKAWPLYRVGAPQSEDWAAIRKGERNGVVLVLLGLAWWKAATADGTAERDDYQDTVGDFAWVITQVQTVASSCLLPEGSTMGLTQTRRPPISDAGPPSKRQTRTSQQLPSPPPTAPLPAAEAAGARRGQKRAAETDQDPAHATRSRKRGRA